jgi:hypothetical protein
VPVAGRLVVFQRGTLVAGWVCVRRVAVRWMSSGLGAGGRMGMSWALPST